VLRLICKFLLRGPKTPVNCVKFDTLRLEYGILVIVIHIVAFLCDLLDRRAHSWMWNISRKYHTNFVYLLIASGEFREHDTFFKRIKYLEAAIPFLVSMYRFTKRKTWKITDIAPWIFLFTLCSAFVLIVDNNLPHYMKLHFWNLCVDIHFSSLQIIMLFIVRLPLYWIVLDEGTLYYVPVLRILQTFKPQLIKKITNNMQQCTRRLVYCSLLAQHVSSDIFAHHQKHIDCVDELELRSNSSTTPAGSDIGE